MKNTKRDNVIFEEEYKMLNELMESIAYIIEDKTYNNGDKTSRIRDILAERLGSNFKEIALEVADIVERKNSDYGNSFEKTINEYGNTAYYLRIEDKLSRLKSLDKKDRKVLDESKIDTLKDIIGYTLLMLDMEYRKGEVL